MKNKPKLEYKLSNRSYQKTELGDDNTYNSVQVCNTCGCTINAESDVGHCTPCLDLFKRNIKLHCNFKNKEKETWTCKDKNGEVVDGIVDGKYDIEYCNCCELMEDHCECEYCSCCEECYEHDVCECEFCGECGECEDDCECEHCDSCGTNLEEHDCECMVCDNCNEIHSYDDDCVNGCEYCHYCGEWKDNGCECIECHYRDRNIEEEEEECVRCAEVTVP